MDTSDKDSDVRDRERREREREREGERERRKRECIPPYLLIIYIIPFLISDSRTA